MTKISQSVLKFAYVFHQIHQFNQIHLFKNQIHNDNPTSDEQVC